MVCSKFFSEMSIKAAPHWIFQPGAGKGSLSLTCYLVNHWSETGFGDCLLGLASSFQPRSLSNLDLSQRLLRRFPESGASLKIRNVGDVSAVLFAVKNIDVVVFHSSSSNLRSYRSTNLRN